MITLYTLQEDFRRFMANHGVVDRIPDWVSWVLADILAEHDYWWNKKLATFTTVDGQAEYFLNHRVNLRQISGLFDQASNFELKEVDVEQIYRFDTTPTDEGSPRFWSYIGQAEVQAVASAAATISVVSSSTNDSGQVVIIRGKVSGVERIETLNLSGTTTVTGTLTWDAGEIESVTLSSACSGVVTATSNSTTIVTLPPGYLRVQCPKIRLYPVPDSSYTISYWFFQRAIKPTNQYDIIDLPDVAFKALRYGIEEIGYTYNGDVDFALRSRDKFKEAKTELWAWSCRNISQNETKDVRRPKFFGERLPYPILVDSTVT